MCSQKFILFTRRRAASNVKQNKESVWITGVYLLSLSSASSPALLPLTSSLSLSSRAATALPVRPWLREGGTGFLFVCLVVWAGVAALFDLLLAGDNVKRLRPEHDLFFCRVAAAGAEEEEEEEEEAVVGWAL